MFVLIYTRVNLCAKIFIKELLSTIAAMFHCRTPPTAAEVFESPESPPPLKKQKVSSDVTVKLQKGADSFVCFLTENVIIRSCCLVLITAVYRVCFMFKSAHVFGWKLFLIFTCFLSFLYVCNASWNSVDVLLRKSKCNCETMERRDMQSPIGCYGVDFGLKTCHSISCQDSRHCPKGFQRPCSYHPPIYFEW